MVNGFVNGYNLLSDFMITVFVAVTADALCH